ncbi:P12 family lipoprotein (plasmid) [Borrelia miyamotoi]
MKEKDLVLSTNDEKEVQKVIEKAERVFQDSEFAKLTKEQVLGLKNEYEQLKTSFYDIFSELHNRIQNKREHYPRCNKRQINKRQNLIQFYNRLNGERSNIDRFMIQVDSGFNELGAAKLFFNKAKDTLKEGITERLMNQSIIYWSRSGDSDLIARRATKRSRECIKSIRIFFYEVN